MSVSPALCKLCGEYYYRNIALVFYHDSITVPADCLLCVEYYCSNSIIAPRQWSTMCILSDIDVKPLYRCFRNNEASACLLVAEPARQAPNKRRKRKVSGGSTVSSGGGSNNNSNSKKKSPANSFSLSSQVPVSITFTYPLSAPPKYSWARYQRIRQWEEGLNRKIRYLWV